MFLSWGYAIPISCIDLSWDENRSTQIVVATRKLEVSRVPTYLYTNLGLGQGLGQVPGKKCINLCINMSVL